MAIFCEFLISENNFGKLFKRAKIISYFVSSTLPLIFYAYFNYLKWQDPLYFIHAHSQLANSRSTNMLVNPLQTIFRYLKIAMTFDFKLYEYWVAILELGIFICAIWGVYLLWKSKARISYLFYTIASLLLPILSGTFSGLPRYFLTLFPIFIVLAQILNLEKNKLLAKIYLGFTTCLLIILFVLFSRGYYIA